MNKKIIISINILVLAVIIGGFIYWKVSQEEPTQNNTTTKPTQLFPVSGNTNTPTQTPTQNASSTTSVSVGMIKIQANDGGNVVMKDFYQSPYTQILDQYKDATIKDGVDYHVEFQPGSQEFFISLSGDDLYASRTNAEQGLLDKLGITKDEACRLSVSLAVAFSESPKASGTNYGLSFCPDGIPLPKNL